MFVRQPLRSLLLSFIGLAVGVLTGCGGAESRYSSHMERGKQFLAQENVDKAGIEFRNALQIEPKSVEALYLNGKIAERHGNLRLAIGLYEGAIDVDTDYIPARASLGRVYALVAAPDRALSFIDPGLAKHPDDPDLLTVRAAARLQLKNLAGARADAQRAVQLAPTNADAVALLAGIYRQDGDLDHAISLVGDTVARMPSCVALRQVLAKLYADASQPEKTGEQLRKIVELQPADFSHRFQLAVFYAGIDRIDDAQRVLTEAVKLQPANGEAKLALVDFISTRRSRAEGEKTLRDFVAREPSNYDLRLGLGALLQRAGSSQEAIAVYREVIKLDGTGAKGLAAQDRIAAIELALGHFDVAQKLVNEVLAKNSHDNEALALRGDMELRRNDATAAIADLRVVLRDQPGAQLARRALARAYLANGEPGLAEEALRIAMEGAPNDPAVRIELAQVLSQRQHGEQAVALLEETVRHSPTDLSARQALARTYLQAHNFVAARTTAEDLKALEPKDASGFYLAALADEGMHKLDDSQKELESALQLQPDAIDALTELVHVYFASGKPAQALARVQEAVDRSPANALPLNLLGEVLFTTRDFPKAEQTFLRAISLSPTWPVPYRNRAVTRLAMGDKAGAIAAYELAVKALPADPQLTVDLATWYEKERRIDDAIRCYEALYQHNPHLQLAANNLALLLASYKSDRASLDRARSLTVSFASSQSAELLDTSGWVQFKRGEYAAALPILQRAAERSPGSVLIRYHLGMAELQAGQRDRARTHLESVLSADGKFPEADEARIALARLKNSIS